MSPDNQSDDQTTVEMNPGRDPSEAPVGPVDIEDLDVEGATVLGAVEVCEPGDLMSLDLDVNFPWFNVDGAEVKDRLESGRYALVKLEEDNR